MWLAVTPSAREHFGSCMQPRTTPSCRNPVRDLANNGERDILVRTQAIPFPSCPGILRQAIGMLSRYHTSYQFSRESTDDVGDLSACHKTHPVLPRCWEMRIMNITLYCLPSATWVNRAAGSKRIGFEKATIAQSTRCFRVTIVSPSEIILLLTALHDACILKRRQYPH